MKRFIKTLIALSLTAVLGLCPLTGFAASESITYDYASSCDWLVTVINPETLSSTTSSRTFVISAVAVEGSVITVYSLNPETNLYEKIYVDGVPLETTVGASGLYAQQITLKDGTNNLMVYASNGVDDQAIRLDITLLEETFLEKLWFVPLDLVNLLQ
ncbi:MAG: hypothetical protein IKB50_01250 [Clostridia bacterium]|nr:hypothetical protein [Clostridia bacterium]